MGHETKGFKTLHEITTETIKAVNDEAVRTVYFLPSKRGDRSVETVPKKLWVRRKVDQWPYSHLRGHQLRFSSTGSTSLPNQTR